MNLVCLLKVAKADLIETFNPCDHHYCKFVESFAHQVFILRCTNFPIYQS